MRADATGFGGFSANYAGVHSTKNGRFHQTVEV
jgi:hypothetical protein